MNHAFTLRLASTNIRRSKEVYLPYFIATAIISGVYFVITGLVHSPGLRNVPNGPTTQSVIMVGTVVFSVFAFIFMVYINNFLIKRRKREFGLYAVLGLEKRHVGRVLLWENVIILGLGMGCGMLMARVFGRLLFMLLMKLINAAPGSEFILSPIAAGMTLLLFGAVFAFTSILNLAKIRLANPIELLQSDKRGEKKDSVFLIPLALIGVLLLGGSYYLANVIVQPGMAIGLFFPLVLLVILATYMLFISGSIVLLRFLRARKRLYYKVNNFVAISGMFHRMRQNAAGLATICILSTMLLVTVSGTTALYLGQEDILRSQYPTDVQIFSTYESEQAGQETQDYLEELDRALAELAQQHHVEMSYEPDRQIEIVRQNTGQREILNPYAIGPNAPESAQYLEHSVWMGSYLVFDLEGTQENCLAFVQDARELTLGADGQHGMVLDIFSARMESYSLYGGLLFLGVFFSVLFLAVTVLIIYFKQITEGYEDKDRFEILQKVGMDDSQVRASINKQVLWVFFLPLLGALCHTAFAANIMGKVLEGFSMFNMHITLGCIGVACAIFAVVYLVVYMLTAKVYYRIVKW